MLFLSPHIPTCSVLLSAYRLVANKMAYKGRSSVSRKCAHASMFVLEIIIFSMANYSSLGEARNLLPLVPSPWVESGDAPLRYAKIRFRGIEC